MLRTVDTSHAGRDHRPHLHGPVAITRVEQYDTLTAEHQTKIQAALAQTEEGIARRDSERIVQVEVGMETVSAGLKVAGNALTMLAASTPIFGLAFPRT